MLQNGWQHVVVYESANSFFSNDCPSTRRPDASLKRSPTVVSIRRFDERDTLRHIRFALVARLVIENSIMRSFDIALELAKQRDFILRFAAPEAERDTGVDSIFFTKANVQNLSLFLSRRRSLLV
jgi:hypothetical protein